jgi:hypothetical protein
LDEGIPTPSGPAGYITVSTSALSAATEYRIVIKAVTTIQVADLDSNGDPTGTVHPVDTELSYSSPQDITAGSTVTIPVEPGRYAIEAVSAKTVTGVNYVLQYGRSASFDVAAGATVAPTITLARPVPTLGVPGMITMGLPTTTFKVTASVQYPLAQVWSITETANGTPVPNTSTVPASGRSTSSTLTLNVPTNDASNTLNKYVATFEVTPIFRKASELPGSWLFVFGGETPDDVVPSSTLQQPGNIQITLP